MTTVLDEIAVSIGWREIPLRAVGVKVSEAGFPNLESLSVFLEVGVVPRSSREDNHNQLGESLEKYQRVLPNDLVFNKLRTWQGGFGISDYEGIVSPAYIIVRLDTELIYPQFLGYLLKSKPYLTELTRLSKWMPPTQFDISWESLRDLKLRIPPIEEQRRIADYLDSELQTIDDSLSLKRTLNAKYLELFRSMATYLCTGKNHSEVSETYLDWIIQAPVGWKKVPLRSLFSWNKGKDPARLDAIYCAQNEGNYPVYSGQTSNNGIFASINTFDFDFPDGCLLITTVGALAGTMRIIKGKFSLSQNCAILTPKSTYSSIAYLNYLWPTIWTSLSSKIPSDMQPSVRLDDLSQTWLYIPTEKEQEEIVKTLNNSASMLDKLRQKNEESISLLVEYRNSLISNLVLTGVSEKTTRGIF